MKTERMQFQISHEVFQFFKEKGDKDVNNKKASQQVRQLAIDYYKKEVAKRNV